MLRKMNLALIAILAVSLPIAAQEETPEFLTQFETYQESLTEPVDFGVYLGGTQNIGKMSVWCDAAPEGSGAVYLAGFKGQMKFASNVYEGQTEASLDGHLGLVSAESRSHEFENGVENNETHSVRRTNGNWSIDSTIDGQTETTQVAYEGPAHVKIVSFCLFARAVELIEGRSHEFRLLDWDPDEEEEPRYTPITMTVSKSQEYTFRGQELSAHRIRYLGEETTAVWITPERKILAIEIEGTPLVFLTGTEEEIGKSIESAPIGNPAESPLAAVQTYFRVFSKEQTVEALDAIMDWESVHAEMAAEDPGAANMSPETLSTILKGEFQKQQGVITKEQVDALSALLKIEIDGDEATVAIPDKEEDPFLLKKGEDGWKITHFPR